MTSIDGLKINKRLSKKAHVELEGR